MRLRAAGAIIKEWSVEDALGSRAAGFNKTGDALYIVDTTGANVGRLKLMEIESGAETFIYEDSSQTYDIGGVVLHPDTRQLQAVRMNREKVEWQFFDEEMKADVERLAGVQPGEISIVGRDRDDKVWLVAFSGDTNTTLVLCLRSRFGLDPIFLFHSARARRLRPRADAAGRF